MTTDKELREKFLKWLANKGNVPLENLRAEIESKESDSSWVDGFMEFILAEIASLSLSLIEALEGERKKHWVFECNGPRPNKTTKYEDFCGDKDCQSEDNKNVIAHNTALDRAKELVKERFNLEVK